MSKLPDWWPAWLPRECDKGHELRPGTVNLSWRSCSCAGAEYGGHQVNYCRVGGCGWHMWPPEHIATDAAR